LRGKSKLPRIRERGEHIGARRREESKTALAQGQAKVRVLGGCGAGGGGNGKQLSIFAENGKRKTEGKKVGLIASKKRTKRDREVSRDGREGKVNRGTGHRGEGESLVRHRSRKKELAAKEQKKGGRGVLKRRAK